MKRAAREEMLCRMETLIGCAIASASSDPSLARRQAEAARRISMRHRIRMPYRLRMVFCRRCKSLMVPGPGSRVRIGRASVRAVRVSCLLCGHVHRKVIPRRAR